MTKFRVGGTIICLISLVLAALFVWALIAGGSYRFWAIAIPVIIGTSAVLGIGFSIGRLMAFTKIDESPEQDSQD